MDRFRHGLGLSVLFNGHIQDDRPGKAFHGLVPGALRQTSCIKEAYSALLNLDALASFLNNRNPETQLTGFHIEWEMTV